jgi:hypothetical protein
LILYKPRSYDAIHFNISSFDLFGIINGPRGLRTGPVSIVENVDFALSGMALKRLSGLAVDRSLRDLLFPYLIHKKSAKRNAANYFSKTLIAVAVVNIALQRVAIFAETDFLRKKNIRHRHESKVRRSASTPAKVTSS